MEVKKTLLNLGVYLLFWSRTTADLIPAAENLRWTSIDFTTVLTWSTRPSAYKYTVLYTADEGPDWLEAPNCIRVSEGECDLTLQLEPLDRLYSADVQTEPEEEELSDADDFPHTFSTSFNPYRESNISAVQFSLQPLGGSSVRINVSDPLTSFYRGSTQTSIRDLLQDRLQYTIRYYKAGSTGKREVVSSSSSVEVVDLDQGESYCFLVAAFIPSRPKASQQGAWSSQRCTQLEGGGADLSVGAVVGIVFILLTILIVFIIVFVLCCKCCRNRTKNQNQNQSSGPI